MTVKRRQPGRLSRRVVVEELLRDRGELLVVSGLGAPTYDVASLGDDDRNFYLWGAMGGAAMIGLGLALAQPEKPVLVITGDGEQLMGMGALATIGAKRPKNFSLALLDNGHYGETGMQLSHTSAGVKMHGVAHASGFAWTRELTDMKEVQDFRDRLHLIEKGPRFASLQVAADSPVRVLPTRDGVLLKHRFRAAVTTPESIKPEGTIH